MMSPRLITLIMSAMISTATVTVAAPLCSQVLRAPPTQEQIAVMFDDLARMTLEADIEKISGIKKSPLQAELIHKTTEIVGILGLKKSDLEQALKPRLNALQKTRELKEEEITRAKKEQDVLTVPHPRFELVNDAEAIQTKGFIGFAGASHRSLARVVHLEHVIGEKFNTLKATDPVTKKEVIVAKEVANAYFHPSGKWLLVFRVQTDPSGVEHAIGYFYSTEHMSMFNLYEFKLSDNDMNIYKTSREFSLAPNGESFAMTSPIGLVMSSSFNNPSNVQNQFLSAVKDVIALGPHEYITSAQTTVTLTKTGPPPTRPLALPTRGYVKALIPLKDEKFLALTSENIFTINSKSMTIENDLPNTMTSNVLMKNDVSEYMIGIENGKPVMRDLNNFTQKSIFNFDMLPKDLEAKNVYLSADKKILIVQGSTPQHQDHYWYLEILGAHQ